MESSNINISSSSSSSKFSLLLLNFLPALLVWPVWLTIGLRENALQESFTNYYPMMIAMVVGSMIAGSTPLGGGVVAFPVAVLVLGLTPQQGRDFSLFIQSVGLSAATYLIFTRKPALLQDLYNIIAISCFVSVIGVIIGFQLTVSPFIINLIYTTVVASFAIILAYVNYVSSLKSDDSNPKASYDDARYNSPSTNDEPTELEESTPEEEISSSSSSSDPVTTTNKKTLEARGSTFLTADSSSSSPAELSDHDDIDIESAAITKPSIGKDNGDNNCDDGIQLDICTWLALTISGFLGGILSSQIGSGADITFYVCGSVYLNSRFKNNKIGGNALTAISVIIMATVSVFGTIIRVTTTGDDDAPTKETYQLWISCAWIVVVGAPVGSLCLTPSRQEILKRLFYLLALGQLIIFGAVKIQTNATAWAGVAGTLATTVILVGIHYYCYYSNTNQWQQQQW